MSFLKGFADAATDKWDRKAKAEESKEAYKFQVDYQLSQQNNQAEKDRSALYDKNKKAAMNLARIYGHDLSVQREIGELAADGNMTMEQIKPLVDRTQGTWTSGITREMKAMAGDKIPKTMSQQSRVNSTPEQVTTSSNIATSAAVIANKTGSNAKQIAMNIGGLAATDGSQMLRAVFKPNDNELSNFIQNLPNDTEKLSVEAAKLDELGTEKGDRYAAHVRSIMDTMGKDHNIKDAKGFIQQEDGTYLKGSYRDGEFYADGEDKPMPLDAIEGTFFNSADGLTSQERTNLTKVMTPVRDMTTSLKTSIRDRAKAIDIVNQHPDALTTVTSVMGGVQSFAVEMNSLFNVASGIITDDPEWEAKWNQKVNNFLASDAFDAVPGAKELSRIQFRLAFAELRAEGQTGQGASNKDVDRVLNNLFPSNPENFGPHMSRGFSSQLQKVQDTHNAFVNDYGDLLAKSTTHNYRLTDNIMQQMKRLESDESYLRGVDLIESYLEEADGTHRINRENQEANANLEKIHRSKYDTEETPTSNTKNSLLPEHIEALQANKDDPEVLKAFEEHFGLKASDYLNKSPLVNY